MKFKDYYEKEFWKQIVISAISVPYRLDCSVSIVEFADRMLEKCRERESD